MIHMDNDYTHGAHPSIFDRLLETNDEATSGYGTDRFTENAVHLIKKAAGREDIAVHLLSGGTQTNIVAITASLRPYQGVVTADTGHINSLEAGAIEAVGHRMLPIPSEDGKIYAAEVEKLTEAYWNDKSNYHKVQPGMVYISNPTETGTIYTKKELTDLRKVCDDHNMILFMDGARLAYGLVAETNDLSLTDITALCDIYYFGGTKVGAMFGEALIIRNEELHHGIKTIIKQKGGLLAKGRALGIQFEVLFKDDLYLELSKHAVNQAMQLKKAFLDKGIDLRYEAYTNQLFPILHYEQLEELEKKYIVLRQESVGEHHRVVRICTNWATDVKVIDQMIEDIQKLP